MKIKNPIITTTRPNLARILMKAGYSVTPQKSVFDLRKTEWEFILDDGSAKIVMAFYKEINKPMPKIIREYLEVADA